VSETSRQQGMKLVAYRRSTDPMIYRARRAPRLETFALREGPPGGWMVGTALFVLAIAFISYSEIKRQFDDAAIIAAHQTASEPVTSWTDYEVGIGPNQPLGQHLGPGQALHSAFRWWCWFSEHP